MRKYETTYIIDSTLTDEEQTGLIDRFQRVVGEQGGTVDGVDKWERRRLAYEVKGKREGIYVVMNFTAPSAAEAELQRVLRLTDNVLRHIVVRVDEKTTKAPAKTEPAPEPREQVTSEPAPEPREQVTSEPAAEATDEPTAEVTGETSESRVEVTS